MLKLKCQYFGLLIQTADSLEKSLMLGRIEAEVEAPKIWPLDAESRLLGKDLDAKKD